MAEELTITFYKIHKCGYYKGNNLKFGNITDTLEDLDVWTKNQRDFVKTKLCDDKSGRRETYFYSLAHASNNTFLLALWNRLPDIQGEVPALSTAKQVNDKTTCTITKLPKNSIPGTASYFWFLPEKNIYATVLRKDRSACNQEMNTFLKTFLERVSKYCIPTKVDNEVKIEYKNTEDDEVLIGVKPSFNALAAYRENQIQYIKKYRADIKKVIRKEVVNVHHANRLKPMKSILNAFGITNKKIAKGYDYNVNYSIDFTPSEKELNEILEMDNKNGFEKYDDTGFVFNSEPSKTHWLSKDVPRLKKHFEIKYIDEEVIDSMSLLQVLNTQKDELLKILGTE